jgi:hypothetical protein
LSEKFEPVDVNPEPCTDGDREAHLRAFVNSFIIKPRRDRCIHIFIESSEKARRELHQIDRWLDPKVSRELEGSARFPRPLQKALGSARGVYFDGSCPSHLLTPAEAATLATDRDAILSIVPGKRALVFHHEGSVYLCERK